MNKNPVVLLILDGFGHSENKKYNAIAQANTPNWDSLKKNFPHSLLNASENFVGLPKGQMGNSEVGHLSIGAGRVIYQDLERINQSINDGQFFANNKLNEEMSHLANEGKSLHIFGLLSDGGVHSHINHFTALLKLAKKVNLKKVYIHPFLDGRDTPPRSALNFITHIEKITTELNCGKIASLCGRFYAMDRDKRWDRTELAYKMIIERKANFTAKTAKEALITAYARDENDEFVSPTLIESNEDMALHDDDAVIFLNFRSDRARQLTNAILDDNFNFFPRAKKVNHIKYYTLTNYDETQKKATPIFKPIAIKNSLGEIISRAGKTQLRIAETEKYPHVTFFFNGGEEKKFVGEDRILIPSPDVKTYDLKPEMSAFELTKQLIQAIESKKYDLTICNYANGDMVGHTGNMGAAIKAIEALDDCLGNVAKAVNDASGFLLITADHGNAELMMDETNNQPHTQHTTNLVPFLIMHHKHKISISSGGTLADIAPSILTIMHEPIPSEMTGRNLIKLND